MSVYNIRYMQLTTISQSISYSPSLQHQCNVGPIDDADAGCSLKHERYDDDDSDDDSDGITSSYVSYIIFTCQLSHTRHIYHSFYMKR